MFRSQKMAFYSGVTIDNLFTAITEHNIDAFVSDYMVNRLITLEDDMPLSYAISYFNFVS